MADKTDINLETFLHCLNPELREAEVGIEPSELNIGTIESITQVRKRIKIINNGPRGLFSCRVSLNKGTDGLVVSIDNTSFASKLKSAVEVATSEGQEKGIINLFPGQSIELILEINPTCLRPERDYKDKIILTKNTYSLRDDISRTIEIPFSFYVDYPAFCKKTANKSLLVKGGAINTLRDLSEYCYSKWLNRDDNRLPDGAIEWIRNSLGEKAISDRIKEVFDAQIKPSEKCYRFLKSTGVIEQERLNQLLKKQLLSEVETERAQRLRDVDNQWQEKIDEEKQRVLNKPNDKSRSFIWYAILVSLFFGIIGAIVGGISVADRISAVNGWRIGLLVGCVIAYIRRSIRANALAKQYSNSTRGDVESQRKGIEENIRDRKTNIDSDIPVLIKSFSLGISESTMDHIPHDTQQRGQKGMGYRYAGVIASLCFLMVLPSFLGNQLPKTIVQTPTPSPVPTPKIRKSPKNYTVEPERKKHDAELAREKAQRNKELIIAANKGDMESVKKLLVQGVDMNSEDYNGRTALMIAARDGHIEVVKALIANGADINYKNHWGSTALSWAKSSGHTEIIQLIEEADKTAGVTQTQSLTSGTQIPPQPLSTKIYISHSSLDFGDIMVRKDSYAIPKRVKPIYIYNKGNTGLVIEKVTTPSYPFEIAKNECVGNISPNRNCEIVISFLPSHSYESLSDIDEERFRNTFEIHSSEGVSTITLYGKAINEKSSQYGVREQLHKPKSFEPPSDSLRSNETIPSSPKPKAGSWDKSKGSVTYEDN